MICANDAVGLKPVIDRHFPLDRLAVAFRYETANQRFGNMVVC